MAHLMFELAGVAGTGVGVVGAGVSYGIGPGTVVGSVGGAVVEGEGLATLLSHNSRRLKGIVIEEKKTRGILTHS